MSDLIERLRMACSLPTGLYGEAADELERLTKLNSQKNADISDWAEKYAEKCNEAAALKRENDYLQAAFLKIRVALGLDLHSNDNLLDAIAEAKKDAQRMQEALMKIRLTNNLGSAYVIAGQAMREGE